MVISDHVKFHMHGISINLQIGRFVQVMKWQKQSIYIDMGIIILFN